MSSSSVLSSPLSLARSFACATDVIYTARNIPPEIVARSLSFGSCAILPRSSSELLSSPLAWGRKSNFYNVYDEDTSGLVENSRVFVPPRSLPLYDPPLPPPQLHHRTTRLRYIYTQLYTRAAKCPRRALMPCGFSDIFGWFMRVDQRFTAPFATRPVIRRRYILHTRRRAASALTFVLLRTWDIRPRTFPPRSFFYYARSRTLVCNIILRFCFLFVPYYMLSLAFPLPLAPEIINPLSYTYLQRARHSTMANIFFWMSGARA